MDMNKAMTDENMSKLTEATIKKWVTDDKIGKSIVHHAGLCNEDQINKTLDRLLLYRLVLAVERVADVMERLEGRNILING